jgi:hypothetical protein
MVINFETWSNLSSKAKVGTPPRLETLKPGQAGYGDTTALRRERRTRNPEAQAKAGRQIVCDGSCELDEILHQIVSLRGGFFRARPCFR